MRKWIIVLLIIVAAFLRFYNLSEWYHFGMDQEYEAYIVKNILSLKHFPLIGVNASDTGLYLGPFFLYFAAIPFWIFQGSPLGWSITASLIGVIVCFLLYKVGKSMFSPKVGLIASFFYSLSFLAIYYDRQFWNPTLVPLFSLLIGYSLYQTLIGKTKALILAVLFFGLSIQSHLSMWLFFPIIIYTLWKIRQNLTKKILVISIALFLFTQAPLLLFEVRHNFLNTKASVGLIGSIQGQPSQTSFTERGRLFLSTLGRFVWVPPSPDLFVESGKCLDYASFRKNAYWETTIIVVLAVLLFVVKNVRNLNKNQFMASRIITTIFLLTFVVILFYKSYFYEYYFLYLFPWLALTLAWATEKLADNRHTRIVAIILLILFIIVNFLTFNTAGTSYSYSDKQEIVKFVRRSMKVEPFRLEALGECARFGGYRYLLSREGLIPQHSYMDSYFSWLYRQELSDETPKKTVLLSLIDPRDPLVKIARWQETKLMFLTENKILGEKRAGDIQVFILE